MKQRLIRGPQSSSLSVSVSSPPKATGLTEQKVCTRQPFEDRDVVKKDPPPRAKPAWKRLVHPSPWLAHVERVTGVVSPGRRLGDATEPRRTRWSATGVKGVTPPGRQSPGDEPGANWIDRGRAKQQRMGLRAKEALRHASKRDLDADRDAAMNRGQERSDEALSSSGDDDREAGERLRPSAGFVPDAFVDVADPHDLKGMVKLLTDFVNRHVEGSESAESWAELIRQSHAPFEITVGYAILSALVNKNQALRRRHGAALDRGARTYFNLARRLSPSVPVPRGLVPETVDALFFDLPLAALAVPYGFVADAFMKTMELFRTREDGKLDVALGRFAHWLYARFVGRRSLGDQPLSLMFPWTPPDWAEDALDGP